MIAGEVSGLLLACDNLLLPQWWVCVYNLSVECELLDS